MAPSTKKTAAKAAARVPAAEAPGPKEDLTKPIRILIQSLTHHVPGADERAQAEFMIQQLRIHVQNFDVQAVRDGRKSIRCILPAKNQRRCYFLLDHGRSRAAHDVTVWWYVWDGASLDFQPQPLPRKVIKELEDYPFAPAPPESPSQRPMGPGFVRQRIQQKLRSRAAISEAEWECCRGHPEIERWLRGHLEPWLWSRYETLANTWKNGKTEGDATTTEVRDPSRHRVKRVGFVEI